MTQPRYTLTAFPDDIYEFDSVGVKGVIPKIIVYTPTPLPNTYNLAFGDKIVAVQPDGSMQTTLDDAAESRNGDAEKIIATVVANAYDYTNRHPDRRIVFGGSDERRTRAYRLAITRHYLPLQEDFDILD